MVGGDSSEIDYSSYKEPLHEKPVFHYAMFLLIIATLLVSTTALIRTNNITGAAVADTVNVNDFLKKLTSHEQMKAYVGIAPLNIVQINQNNIANLQTQITGLDTSYIGDFIVQYTDAVIIYDYDNNEIKGNVNLQQLQDQQQTQAQLPDDFFTKLNNHPELQGLENEQPTGGQLDEASLNTLNQQFPDVYAGAKVGDFLLRYQTKLIIYDYNADTIINSVNLG